MADFCAASGLVLVLLVLLDLLLGTIRYLAYMAGWTIVESMRALRGKPPEKLEPPKRGVE